MRTAGEIPRLKSVPLSKRIECEQPHITLPNQPTNQSRPVALPIPPAQAASRWRNSLNGINEPLKRANGAGQSRQNQRHQPRQNRRPRNQQRAPQRTTRPPKRNHAAPPPPPRGGSSPAPPVKPQPPATIHVRLLPDKSRRNDRPSSHNGQRLPNHNAKTHHNGRLRGVQRHNSDRSGPPPRHGVGNNRPNPMPGNPDPAITLPPDRETPGSNNAAKPPVSTGVGSTAVANSPGNSSHGCNATSRPPRRHHVNNPARVPPTPVIGQRARLVPRQQAAPIRRLPKLPRPAPGGAPPVRLGIRPTASQPNSHRNAPNVPSAPGSQPNAGPQQTPTNPRVGGPLPRAMVPEAVGRIDKPHGRIITIHKNPRVVPHPSLGCAAAGRSTMTCIADTSNRRFVLSFKRT